MNSILNSYFFLFLFLAFILAFWIFGFWLSLYYVFWWYDMIAHFLGGLWIAFVFLFFKKRFRLEVSGNWNGPAVFISAMGVVALVGVLWELSEFVSDRYIFRLGFTYFANVFEDTLSDLFIDLLGGIAGYLIYKKNG